MFRKPKAKGAIRQRKTEAWDDSEGEKLENEPIAEKKPAAPRNTMSFDADEGADSTFKLKKDKKKVEELKRQIKLEDLEEEAANIWKEEKERKEALEKVIKKEKQSKEEKKTKNERQKYLDKYRDDSVKRIAHSDNFEYDEHLDIDSEAIARPFTTIFDGIPDSQAVYEAKKRRERARREGNQDQTPLDDTQKLRTKNERNRLIREDENDDSDEELGGNKFYSARELLKTEEDRKREEQEHFLERENGDFEETQRRRREHDDDDEWEQQQIQKAVSGRAIGRLRNEKKNTAKLFGHAVPVADDTEMDMDIDMDVDVEMPGKFHFTGPTNTGGVIKLDDILAKLKLKVQEREEALNFKKEEQRKLEQSLEENKNMISKLEIERPSQSEKYTMYQELRAYSRSLLACLNEKVDELNTIIDKRRACGRARTTRHTARRRQDVRDQHAEHAYGQFGKTQKTADVVTRTAEREARRGRRRRERESSENQHEEGLSTDDEDTVLQTTSDQKTCDEVDAVASVLFADARDEYAELRKVLGRMMDWLAVDPKSFQDAYIHECLPKLCSPYVRLELLTADVLRNPTSLPSMKWFQTVIVAGSENAEIDQNHEILVDLAPAIVEKVVIPYLIDTIKEEWDPMSLSQTRNLANFCSIFAKLANLTEKSKMFVAFLNAIRAKLCESIAEDLFMPVFPANLLENPQCRQFHDRQFWTCIKLIKSINALSPLISVGARFELVVEKCVNSHCVMALRTGARNDAAAERKVRGLLAELDDSLLMQGGMSSFPPLIGTLEMIAEAQSLAGRSFHKEIRKFLAKLERK